jgi:hypothetical protein
MIEMQSSIQLTNAQVEELVRKYPDMSEPALFQGSIGEFYSQYTQPFAAPSEKRRDELLDVVEIEARKVFTDEDVTSMIQGLRQNYLVSTAEHHASITYSQQLNVVYNQFLIQRQHKLPVISLSCGTTTLENELYPRGVFYEYEKLPFLSKNYKSAFACDAPPINEVTFPGRIKELLKMDKIGQEDAEFLRDWFENEYEHLRGYSSLSKQISVLNKRLWKGMIDESLHYENFNYFMIPAEDIVINWLQREMNQPNPSWVFQAMFEPNRRAKMTEAFNGTRLCWDLETGKGTYLFWAYNAKKRPSQMHLSGDRLRSECGTVDIPMTPQGIYLALKNEQIVPASSLCCLYMAFYGGLTMMGGILQVNYLSDMKRVLLQENNPLGLSEQDLQVIRETKTNLYANFQGLPWNEGGLKRLNNKLTAEGLAEYEAYDHFSQIQECLDFLLTV